MILGAIRDIFLDSTEVTDLVGTKIYAVWVPQGVQRPHVDIRIVNTQADTHLTGNTNMYKSIVTIDVTTNNVLLGDEIATALMESGIVSFKGIKSGVDIRGVDIDEGIYHIDEGVEPGSDEHVTTTTFSLEIAWARSCT